MDGREFVRMVKQEAIEGAVHSIVKSLTSPRSLKPSSASTDPIQKSMADFYNAGAQKEQERAAWFRSLSPEHQAMFTSLLEECAEMSALSFCTLIDGVGGPYEGVFEIRSVDAKGRKTLLNPENSEMLHDLLSEICVEDRES